MRLGRRKSIHALYYQEARIIVIYLVRSLIFPLPAFGSKRTATSYLRTWRKNALWRNALRVVAEYQKESQISRELLQRNRTRSRIAELSASRSRVSAASLPHVRHDQIPDGIIIVRRRLRRITVGICHGLAICGAGESRYRQHRPLAG